MLETSHAPPASASREQTAFIEVAQLTKRFADVIAVDRISFEVRKGELFGFLGPNGAGKTTTINLLTGLARPDYGMIRVGGVDCVCDPKAAQHLIGVVPDESNLYPALTGFENLCFCAALYGIRKGHLQAQARRLLESFGLADAAQRKFEGYSRGMKRKLTLAAGIIHNPHILFLDEPTTGLDVVSARHVRQLIAGLHRSFERLLLAPIPLDLLMLAKTGGAILFGIANAFVPIVLAAFFTDLSAIAWTAVVPAAMMIAVASTFLGLFIAVSASEIFEAQTFSNFFRFPMIFLFGLFFPIDALPVFVRPLSYLLPLTYGVDILHGAMHQGNAMPLVLDFAVIGVFCAALFFVSVKNVHRKWIV